jgi:hypothetical protein
METSSDEALHADTQDCKSRFDWQDFNRFSTGECLSFGIRTPADIDIAIAVSPSISLSVINIYMLDIPHMPVLCTCVFS